MNEPMKEAAAAAVPEKLPDPRDHLLRRQPPEQQEVSETHPVAAALQGGDRKKETDPGKVQEMKRKHDALRPLA